MSAVMEKRLCPRCGKLRARFIGAVRGDPWCQVCHKRESTPAACTDCQAPVRARPGETPRCVRCRQDREWAGQRCARCDRALENRKRRRLPDGRGCCTSCIPYFRAPKTCHYCGASSLFVIRDFKVGLDQPACRPCRSKKSLRLVCAACRKPRRIAGVSAKGKPLCRECQPTGQRRLITCERCHQHLPAGTKRFCVDCAWERIHLRLLRTLVQDIPAPWARDLFMEYHGAAMSRVLGGAWQNALRKDQAFFIELARQFGSREELSGVLVVRRLSWKTVDRHRRAMSFLAQAGLVVLDDDPDYQLEVAIARIRGLIPVGEGWVSEVPERFLTHVLNVRAKVVNRRRRTRIPVTPKSIESALRSTLTLVRFARDAHRVDTVQGLTQDIVDLYLSKRSRQNRTRAFLRYLNEHEHLFQRLRCRGRTPQTIGMRDVLSEAHRRRLLAFCEQATSPLDIRAALIILFGLLYVQPVGRTMAMRMNQLQLDRLPYQVRFGKVWLDLDPLTQQRLEEWLARRRGRSDFDTSGPFSYLFPGTSATAHLRNDALLPTRRALGFVCHALHRTALATHIRHGVTQPRVLSECFGVSLETATAWCTTLASSNAGAQHVKRLYAPR